MTASPGERDRILFLMRSPVYLRNFESVLLELGSRGLRTTVLFEERKLGDEPGLDLMRQLCREHDSLRFEVLGPLPRRLRGRVRKAVRAIQDYLRYFDVPYGHAAKLRSRALGRVPDPVERAIAGTLARWRRGRRTLASAARHVDRRLGDDPDVRRQLEARRPALLVVTPMVQLRSRQSDWVRAAHRLGIGTMLCVHGWDNLTNKGLMHALPDRVVVWNEAHRREAIELHGSPAGSVIVAGAWPYDHWFGWRARRARPDFCRELGLPGDRAMLLYVCSSSFIAERELPAVRRWIRALRSAEDPRVAMSNVIVRPHPLNGDEWGEPSFAELPGVRVFPPWGADPVDEPSRSDYFDSIVNADAVVGINTSALIESAIVGRPALALPDPEFRSSQDELPHFRELVGDDGIVKVAASMAEHVAQLGQALSNSAAEAERRRRFIEAFIRPQGGSPSPSQRVVAAIEELLDGVPAASAEPAVATVP
jgi:hypothetical protein